MRTRGVTVCLLVVAACCIVGIAMVPAPTVAEGPAGMEGNGTESDPYEITNVTQLQAMNESLSAKYVLVRDVDASATSAWNGGDGFDPIGNASSGFTGSLDGNDTEITGLTIDRAGTDDVGLFESIDGGTVVDLTLSDVDVAGGDRVGALVGAGGAAGTVSNVTVDGSVSGAGNVGLLAGQTRDDLSGIHAVGAVNGSGSNVGGVVGQLTSGSLVDSVADVAVTGASGQVGGVIGTWNGGEVSNVHATGPVTATGDDSTNVGGSVGRASSGVSDTTLNGATATGAVNASDADHVGGLVGYSEAPIRNGSATGDVSGADDVGGLVGVAGNAVSNSSASGAVAGTASVGGLVGSASTGGQLDGSVAASTASGDVTGAGSVGGLVGSNTGPVDASSANGSVTGAEAVGGLVGSSTGPIADSSASGSVEGSGQFVGGLAGVSSGGVDASRASGDVDAPGANSVGGLIGASQSVVTESTATGTVAGGGSVGGLLGQNVGSATDVSATGSVSGDGDVGGLVGTNRGDEVDTPGGTFDADGELSTVFATGTVDGGDVVTTGGLIGNDSEGDVSSAYWNVDASPDLDADDGVGAGSQADVTGLAADELRGGTARASMDGFAFGETWVTVADSSPVLLWTPDAPEPASFDVSIASTPDGYAGENLVVTAAVTSSGEEVDVPKTITLEVLNESGERVGSLNESVTLDPGQTETVLFEWPVPADFDTQTVDLSVASPDDEASATVDTNGFETMSGTLTDDVSDEALSGVDVTVDDGEGTRTVETDANGEYEFNVLNDCEVTVSASTTVDGAEETIEISGSNATTVDGATMLDLALYPELPGSGTEANPYEIGNAYGMQAMNQDLDGHYVLVDDVNASGTKSWNDGEGFDPVGTTDGHRDPDMSTVFRGSLDGQNQTITGLTINTSDEPYIGLFGVATNTTIENLTLTNIDVTPSYENVDQTFVYTGGLVGLSERLNISSVNVSGSVSGELTVGGVVGGSFDEHTQQNLTMKDVTADVDVLFDTPSISDGGGGVVGFWSNPATIENVRSSGDVTGSAGFTGGFAGLLGDSTGPLSRLSDVSVSGNVSTDSMDGNKNAGGLIGGARDVHIVRSAATGNIYTNDNEGVGTTYAGGLIGETTSGPLVITDSYATGDVGALDGTTGADYAGGLIGDAASEINNSYASGSVDGSTVGGIAGASVSEMTNVYWNASTAANATTSGAATGATGLTPVQMAGANATEHMDGLDYETTWLAVENEDTYPVLGWQVESYDLALADDEIDVGNTTEATVAVALDDGTVTTATTTSNYTASGNVSVDDRTVTADATYGPGTVIATGGGLSDSASITALDSDVRVRFGDIPAAVGEGSTDEFPVIVENVGNDAGTSNVSLAFDGTEFYDEPVKLAAGANRTIAAEYEIPAGIGTGTVELNATTLDDAANATVDVRGFETLSGTLTDGVTGEPLADVDVEIDGEAVATTDANGTYATQVVNGTDVTISASPTVDAPGSPVISATETAAIDGSTTQSLTLWPDLAGNGTVADPYEIANAHELQAMSQNLSAHYVLVDDVDASGTAAWNGSEGFEPIGDDVRAFNGTFRGAGHEITDLTIGDALRAGLFGTTGSGSYVSNLTLLNATMHGDTRYAGLLVGSNDGTVSSVHAGGTVTDPDDTIGGLVGLTNGDVRNSSADVEVTGGRVAGGLVGVNFLGNVTRSASTGSVDSDVGGGLVGENAGSVNDSYSTATVRGETAAGGLVGQNAIYFLAPVNGTISGSYAAGLVDPDGNASDAGGLVGTNSDGPAAGTATDSYWDADTTGQAHSDGGGTGLTTTEMTGVDATATGNMDSLDGKTVWTFTDGYPHLTWEIDGLDLALDPTTLESGETADVTVILTLADGSTVTATETAAYAIDDASVATVANGTITAVGDGTATITAELAGRASSTAIDVRSPSPGNDGASGGGVGRPPSTSNGNEPSVSVVDVSVDTANPAVGETISATVTVENGGLFAETYDGALALDGESIAEESITVDAGETVSYTVTRAFEAAGEYTLSAGGESVTITVGDDPDDDDADDGGEMDDGNADDDGDGTDDSDESSDDGTDDTGDGTAGDGTDDGSDSDGTPGFGAIVALVSIALVAATGLARRS